MTETDAALLTRIRTDRDALETFFRRHVDAVEQFAVGRCRGAEEAAELVSAVFLALIEGRAVHDGRGGSALPWLLGVARNLLADERRRWWRDERLRQRLAGQAVLRADEATDLEDRIDAARQAPAFADALAGLTSGERELMLLVAYDGLSVADAARVVGISPTAGRMRLRRARLRLRRALAGAPPGSPARNEVS